MYRTDEETLTAARELLGVESRPAPPPLTAIAEPAAGQEAESELEPEREPGLVPPSRRQSIITLAAIGLGFVVLIAVALLLSRGDGNSEPIGLTPPEIPAGTTTATTTLPALASAAAPVPAAAPLAASTVHSELLGPIGRTIVRNGVPVAIPGQPVTAPAPLQGTAVGWQWELCDPDCTVIGGATDQTWTSPPTPQPVDVRVVVEVDLTGAQLRVASAPYRALPWPDTTEPTSPAAVDAPPALGDPAPVAPPADVSSAETTGRRAVSASDTVPASEPTATPSSGEPVVDDTTPPTLPG